MPHNYARRERRPLVDGHRRDAFSTSGDPRFNRDANVNWVTSLGADRGTIGVVDGCGSYIPSAGSGDDDVAGEGGSC
jgi:hypothetical protein